MNYDYLKLARSPRILVEGVKLIGVKEIVGKQHSQEILRWASEVGLEKTYTNDEIPWCGLFMAFVAKKSGLEGVKDPLWALNWNKFGTKQSVAMLGDVLTFKRGSGGHVGIYVGEDALCYHILGGNQSNMVNVTRIQKSRLSQIRRTTWRIAQPANVVVVQLTAKGLISKNEA